MGARRRSPEPPDGLSVERASLFRRLAEDLVAVGAGAEVDLILAGELCRRIDRLEEVRAVLAAEGVSTAGSKGQVRAHPLLAAEAALSRDVLAAFDRLKLSPATRPDERDIRIDRAGRLKRQP